MTIEDPSPRGPLEAEGATAVLPPVVVVVVAHDPGDWFDETLRSIDAQTYTNLSVLVIDAGSTEPVAPRVAAVLPDARERRIDDNPGFAAACNQALDAVRGAAFYLFCHDDVRLDADVVRLLVEEAFRSNAGIVGPKLVHWNDPDRLLSIGMGADRTGQPAALIEPGELDQAQHDTVRDVFWVPGAVTLVRADLFAALGGFDGGISFHGEDLDMCWRAHVAGARVVVTPAARVAHLEALGVRREEDDRRRLQMRHRQRTLRICTSRATRVRVLPLAALLSALEIVYSIVVGRWRQAADVAHAWAWNARNRRDVGERRRALDALRAVPDGDVRAMQVRGSARLRAYARGQLGRGDDRLLRRVRSGKMADALEQSTSRVSIAAWTLVAVVLIGGSRDLVRGPIPAVGDFASFGGGTGDLFASWLGGYTTTGMGAQSAAPPALALFAAVATVLLGATELARAVLILAALPVGVVGIWRLARPVGSRRARVAALVVFVANPLTYNALAQGHWSGLVLCALTPWMLLHLAKASRLAPFGPIGDSADPLVSSRPLLHHVVALGMVTALAGLWFPPALALVVVLAVALAVGGLLVGQWAGAARLVLAGFGGAVVGFVLLAPWSIELVMSGDPQVWLAGSASGVPEISAGSALRFETGPVGGSTLSWALPVAASLGLLIGRSWRLGWAARCWAVTLVGWIALEVAARGWVPAGWPLPTADVLLAAGVGSLALAAAMGVAAFEVDLRDYHFGWRQLASVLAASAVVVSILPMLGSAAGGRWDMPRRDLAEKLAFTAPEADSASFRVLWVGDAELLPLAGWEIDGPFGAEQRVVFGTSWGGPAVISDLWAGAAGEGTVRVREALEQAVAGETSRLGELVAPMGVRYLVVPDLATPLADGELEEAEQITRSSLSSPTAPTLVDVFDRQLDLATVPIGGAVRIYENAEWVPALAVLDPAALLVREAAASPALAEELRGAEVILGGAGPFGGRGVLEEPGVVYVAWQDATGWELTIDARSAPRREVDGWAMAFDAAEGGEARLSYSGGLTAAALALGSVVLWLLAAVGLLRSRARSERERHLSDTVVVGAGAVGPALERPRVRKVAPR